MSIQRGIFVHTGIEEVKKIHTQECNRPVSSLHTRAKSYVFG